MLGFNLPAFVADNSAIIMIIASAITLPMAWISDAALRDMSAITFCFGSAAFWAPVA